MKKLLLALALMLMALTASAQAYKIETKKDNNLFIYSSICHNITKEISDIEIGIKADKESVLLLYFNVFPLVLLDNKNKERNKNLTISLTLSNGEVITSNKNIAFILYGVKSKYTMSLHTFISNQNNSPNNYGQYAASLLRSYDITKISVDGKSVTTPNFHSADTFDAMFKEMKKNTVDFGQYGKRLTKSTTTTNTHTKTSTSISQKSSNNSSTNKTQQNNSSTNPSNSQPSTRAATTSANTQISTKYKGIRMLIANSENYYPNKTTSNDFSAYDLSTKVLGIINNPSAKMNIEDIVNGLLSYMPNLKMELRNSMVYDFKNMEISCNGKNLIYNIKFNSDYSLKSFDYYAYFQTKEEAIAYMKKIQAELESKKISFNIGRGDAIYTDYKYYPNSISISVNKNKDKKKSKMEYVLWWFCSIK